MWLSVAERRLLLWVSEPPELSVECVLSDESPLGPEKLFCKSEKFSLEVSAREDSTLTPFKYVHISSSYFLTTFDASLMSTFSTGHGSGSLYINFCQKSDVPHTNTHDDLTFGNSLRTVFAVTASIAITSNGLLLRFPHASSSLQISAIVASSVCVFGCCTYESLATTMTLAAQSMPERRSSVRVP